jgi:hypothetical protein
LRVSRSPKGPLCQTTQGESIGNAQLKLHVCIVELTSGVLSCDYLADSYAVLLMGLSTDGKEQPQSSMLSPIGAKVLSRFIHLRSTRSRMVIEAGLLGALCMNSRALILTSKIPLWVLSEKCLATLCSRTGVSIPY